jgi:hypothetical protein
MCITEDNTLYAWCVRQRRLYRDKKLSYDNIELLNSIQFIFDLSAYLWMQYYKKLKDYYIKNKSYDRLYYDDRELYNWICRQRTLIKLKKLDSEKIKLLKEVSFNFTPCDYDWMNMFKKLKKYFNNKGHSNITVSEDENLYRWVHHQRDYYNKNKLASYKIKLLNSVDFIFKVHDKKWQDKYNKLLEYCKKNMHCNVTNVEDISLYKWACYQRLLYKENKLSDTKIKLLNDISFFKK